MSENLSLLQSLLESLIQEQEVTQTSYQEVGEKAIEKIVDKNDMPKYLRAQKLVTELGYDIQPSVLANNLGTIFELLHHDAMVELGGKGYEFAQKIDYVAQMNLVGNPISINDLKED